MSKTLQLGKRGEDLAVTFLRKKGFSIIDRNVRLPDGEIDIIAEKNLILTIIEVKTRSSLQYGEPYEAVDRRKQLKLLRLAEKYALQKGKKDSKLSVGVISILFDESTNSATISLYDYFT